MAVGVPGALRGEPGGIVALADLIDEHRGAFEYDWRTRFGLPLASVGKGMSWGEALRLAKELQLDPSSHVARVLLGWQYPSSRLDMAIRDLFDLTHQIAAGKKRPKPYPRPWDRERRHGTAAMPVERMRALLDRHRAAAASEAPSQVI